MPHVSGLFVYPIKSLGGVALEAAVVERRGLAWDRRWMLVNEEGVFQTQRQTPELARFKVSLAPGGLVVRHPEAGELFVPQVPAGEPMTVRVWQSVCEAVRVGGGADAWFSAALGRPCHLVRMPETTIRPTSPDYSRPGDHVSFADGFPLLLIGEASLADLNARLETPVPMNRFRPNLVVAGTAPFAEDAWAEFTIGDVRFRGVKPCGRCLVTTIDQESGQPQGPEPLRTLTDYRLIGKSANFGMNCIPEGEGRVGRLMELRVLRT